MGYNLADLLESVAAAVPDREAVVTAAGADGEPERRLTHRQLDERADRLAHVLAGFGVGADDVVGLMLRNGNEYLEGMLACFKLRAVPANISYRATAAEVSSQLDGAGAVALLHEPELAGVVASAGHLGATLARGVAWEGALAAAPAGPVAVPGRSGDDRYLLYTGGTTGRPKGVVWRHEDLFHGALGGGTPGGDGPVTGPADLAAAAPTGRARYLPASPFTHGTGHWSALTALLGGGTVVCLREAGFDAARMLDVVVAEAVTCLVVVGDAFGRPILEALEGRCDLERMTPLNVILSGGATLAPATKTGLLRLLPWAIVVDGFGSSETGGQGQWVTYPGAPDAVDNRFRMGADSVVLDDDHRPLPPGSGRVGWLARRGHLPIGYVGDPEATRRTFLEVDGVRWAIPGDRAVQEADGTIVVHGRDSSTINTGGEKVQAEEVEAAVRTHPAVLDAVVVGVQDERWGEVVAAVVAVRPGTSVSVEEVAARCGRALAPHKLPRRLVVVDEVVRSPSGKPDLRWARAAASGS